MDLSGADIENIWTVVILGSLVGTVLTVIFFIKLFSIANSLRHLVDIAENKKSVAPSK